jgi:hypothetical protein
MTRFRFREEESSTGTAVASAFIGAVAGFAVGMYVAQRVGGFGGLARRLRRKRRAELAEPAEGSQAAGQFDEIEELDEAEGYADSTRDEDEDFNGMDDTGTPILEERVLEAFNNDPILAERAIDIGSVGEGIIELAGWVETDDEAEHAMTVARGVPGVDTVVNRLLIEEEEEQVDSNVKRFAGEDPALRESRWEGQQVGTGKRRQGTSDEADRHADPKPVLEDRWLSEKEAVRNAADDLGEISAERRTRRKAKQGEPQPEA